MKKTLLLLLLVVNVLQAELREIKELRLKKDVEQQMIISDSLIKRALKFRWTLYAGDGLTMHLNFNDFNRQFILYQDYKRDSFALTLLPKASAFKREPYLLLVFKKFDQLTKEVVFTLLIDDDENRAQIKFINKR